MLSFAEAGFPMGAGTSSSGGGVVGHHAYSVLDVRELHGYVIGEQKKLTSYFKVKDNPKATNAKHSASSAAETAASVAPEHVDGLRLLQIRNPWGKKEWEGQFGRQSDQWTRRLRAQLPSTRENDGTFWIPWHDFLMRFSNVDVLKAHKGWHMMSIDCGSDGGSVNAPCACVLASVQLRVMESAWLYLSLYTKDVRAVTAARERNVDPRHALPMSMLVVKEYWRGGDKKERRFEPVRLHLCGQRASSHCELLLDEPQATYHVILLARPFSKLTMRVFSSVPVTAALCKYHEDQNMGQHTLHTLRRVPLPLLVSCLQQSLHAVPVFLQCGSSLLQRKTVRQNMGVDGGITLELVQGMGASMLCATNSEARSHIITVVCQAYASNERKRSIILWPGDSSVQEATDVHSAAGGMLELPDSSNENDDVIVLSEVSAAGDVKPPAIQIRKVMLPPLCRRILAFGLCVSKYTDEPAIRLISASSDVSGVGNQGSLSSSWMFSPASLF